MNKLLITLFIVFASPVAISLELHSNDKFKLSPQETIAVTQNIAHSLEHIYLYPERAKDISQKLIFESNTGRFKRSYDTEQYRSDIRATIVKATHDTAIDVIGEQPLLGLASDSVKVETSDNNIGYMSITGDSNYTDSEELILKAFDIFKNVDAMIIDIRSAGKVDLSLVQVMLSYFVEEGTLLGKVVSNDQVSSLVARKTTGYDKFKNNFPLYILNSSFVSGEWEFFSYSLQQVDKAKVIGESTMGIGYLTKYIKVANNILLKLPYARIVLEGPDETWEKSGVIPNYFTDEKEAFNKAYSLALLEVSNQ
jgi:C-terminal processing protease CtpA/Prc